jgi:hypothetical protein
MKRSKLSEEIYRLLPSENSKRIREAILLAFTNASGAAREFVQATTVKISNGILITGTVDFPSTTSAVLKDWAWTIESQNFAVPNVNLPVDAPEQQVSRIDSFVGNDLGEITYLKGENDLDGNAKFPIVPNGTILLLSVLRNPDNSFDQNDPPDINFFDGLDNGNIPMFSNTKLIPSGLSRSLENFIFNGRVKGAMAQSSDDFATFGQLPNAVSYDSFDGKTNVEKQQARDNISVYSADEINNITGNLIDLNTADKDNLVIGINQSNSWKIIEW